MRIILVIMLIAAMLVGLVHLWSRSLFRKYVESLFEDALNRPAIPNRRVVNFELLPDMIRNLARRSGANPDQLIHGVRFRQSAELRMAPDKAWQTLTTKQITLATEPGFTWYAEQKTGPFTTLQIVDAYLAGEGILKARLFGSVPVADVHGQVIAHSELLRYLAELAWTPDAFYHNHHLKWTSLGDRVVQVETDDVCESASVRLIFDGQGDLVEIQADERGSLESGMIIRRPWRGMFSDYREIGGRRIPARGEVGYIYEDGYAAYFRGEIVEYKVIP